jgi:hypothetical protein
LRGGFGSLFYWKDYEVITAYSDGTTSSDRGLQSNKNFLITFLILMVVGVFITITKMIFLVVKYVINFIGAQKKPHILKSAFPVILLAFILFWAGMLIPSGMAQGKTMKGVREREALNEAAVKIAMNVPAENGYPMKISEIRYRSDATVIIVTETERGAAQPFVFNVDGPEKRWRSGASMLTTFELTAPSGTYTASMNRHRTLGSLTVLPHYADSGSVVGIELHFPVEFTDTTFDLEETTAGIESPVGPRVPNPLIFRNVRVNK